jgi:radical SAM protein with 4Fe4S-binding SPASM domain
VTQKFSQLQKLKYSGNEKENCLIAKSNARSIHSFVEDVGYDYTKNAIVKSQSLIFFVGENKQKLLGKTESVNKDEKTFLNPHLLGLSILELNVTDLCNRKCWMCPRHDPAAYPNNNAHMSFETVKRVVDSVSKVGWTLGTITFGGWGEPLLNPDILKMIRYTRDKLPEVNIELVTNGDRLRNFKMPGYDKPLNALELYECGLSSLYLDVYDNDDLFIEHLKLLEPVQEKLTVIVGRRYMDVVKSPYISRAGLYNIKEQRVMTSDEQQFLNRKFHRPCYLLMYKAFVHYTGELLSCCHDWRVSAILGNVNKRDFVNLWNDPKTERWRKTLAKDRTLMTSSCATCDSNGGVNSPVGNHVKKIYKKKWKNILTTEI